MTVPLADLLLNPDQVAAWLTAQGVTDLPRGVANLQSLADCAARSSLVTLSQPSSVHSASSNSLTSLTRSSANSIADTSKNLSVPSTLHPLAALAFSELQQHLVRTSDPDRALNNLERVVAAHGWESLSKFLEIEISEKTSTTTSSSTNTKTSTTTKTSPVKFLRLSDLLKLFSDSQYLSDLFVGHRAFLKSLEKDPSQLVTRKVLVQRLHERLETANSTNEAISIIRRFKQAETIHIAIADLVRGYRLEQITEQISLLAEAVCECTYAYLWRRLVQQWGAPRAPDGVPARYVILAMGKLGGTELNYSSDIDLVMVYDVDGETDGALRGLPVKTNREFFEHLTREFLRMHSEPTSEAPAYRIDMRLRPEGSRGKICSSYQSLMHYYDFQGRTWERQALIKTKPIAGNLELGARILRELNPWIYRRSLSRVDIAGIKALKRGIERKSIERGEATRNIKTGPGGIRDIEFVIQFLQLLNGGVVPETQTPGTLAAIKRLEGAGCLTTPEATLLAKNYTWLRKLEHRLQLMFDLQTHSLPEDESELRKMAHRMGYRDDPDRLGSSRADASLSGQVGSSPNSALDEFRKSLADVMGSNRTISHHLLLGAFGNTYGSLRDTGGHLAFAGDESIPVEVDLILEPNPTDEFIERTLGPYGFRDVPRAYVNLMELAIERTPFLSTRRCLHFLAAIAPALLEQISRTPDPDGTLVSLSSVSDSLGAKGVLWELFRFNPPTLGLYVRLCAASGYLAGILKTNPGMIDELIDALQIQQLPSLEFLQQELDELTRGATDIAPIVFSFKNAHHLRIGIRDILGRDDLQRTHRALSDVAEVCLRTIARHEFKQCLSQFDMDDSAGGDPIVGIESANAKDESACPLVILAMGKLGGREPNYHSDLDVIFLYGHDVEFEARLPGGVSSQFFFSELAARVTRFVTHSSHFGRLYDLDSRLRPGGHSGALAVSIDEFSRYFQTGQGRLWERQALCKSRPVFGASELQISVMQQVHHLMKERRWSSALGREIAAMRISMLQNCSPQNWKRGIGGTVDVEFAIQALQLKHYAEYPSVLVPGTLEAIDELAERGLLLPDSAEAFSTHYDFLRSVEAKLRLVNTTTRHDLPDDKKQLNQLAHLLNMPQAETLQQRVAAARQQIRKHYDRVFSEL